MPEAHEVGKAMQPTPPTENTELTRLHRLGHVQDVPQELGRKAAQVRRDAHARVEILLALRHSLVSKTIYANPHAARPPEAVPAYLSGRPAASFTLGGPNEVRVQDTSPRPRCQNGSHCNTHRKALSALGSAHAKVPFGGRVYASGFSSKAVAIIAAFHISKIEGVRRFFLFPMGLDVVRGLKGLPVLKKCLNNPAGGDVQSVANARP